MPSWVWWSIAVLWVVAMAAMWAGADVVNMPNWVWWSLAVLWAVAMAAIWAGVDGGPY